MKNAINWVEIPAVDIHRAAAFYSKLYDRELGVIEGGARRLVLLPYEEGGVGASLNQTENFPPGDKGPLVYLNAGEDLTPMLNRVEAAGGQIITAKSDLGGTGFYAMFRDSEGNVVALMSSH
ncbi:MAG: VOC family protein [bacterium]|nr:VOC family protein [bacterium]